MSFIYCTCWVPTISVLNLAIFSCYTNLLLRRRKWTGILRRGVLCYVLLRLSFMWCYGVVLVFKDIIYVIIILYTHDIWLSVNSFARMCGTIDPESCIRWVLGFSIKTGYDRGAGPTYKASPSLIVVVVDDAWWGKGSFPEHRCLMEGLSYLIPVYGILQIVNSFLPSSAYLLVVSWCYLDVFPRHSDVGWRWDGFPTRVRSARGAWVPTAMSNRGRFLGSTLPETCNGRCLSALGSP
jgi:hypothetical protein